MYNILFCGKLNILLEIVVTIAHNLTIICRLTKLVNFLLTVIGIGSKRQLPTLRNTY